MLMSSQTVHPIEVEVVSKEKVSLVAILQAGGTWGSMLAVVLGYLYFPGLGMTWLVLALTPFLMPGVIIALELLCVARTARQNGDDGRSNWKVWVRTWWVEWCLNLLVFAWRQPFAWKRLPDSSERGGDRRSPVVFVHGYLCNSGFWQPWLQACRDAGRPYATVNLEPVFSGIDAYVPQIEAAVHRVELATGRRPVLVGHSMGGLAIRAWLAFQPTDQQSRWLAVITIGTPHRGTWLARWSRTASGQQMRLGSEWLAQLRAREEAQQCTLNHARFLCWSSETDNVVFPVEAAGLPGADHRRLHAAGHIELAYLPSVISSSLEWIASAERSPAALTRS